MFKYLVLFSAFLIEAIGTYVSIVGLSSLFAANLVIIILAGALDLGKVVSVSFLYKYFKTMNVIMKTYMVIATMVLMMITSAGAFGYLSGEFQRAISDTNQSQVIMKALEEEQTRLQARKKEIDNQIAKLPDNSVRGRTALMKQFEPEVSKINERLIDIDAELPTLKIEAIKKGVEVGPIIYIAEAFNTTPEEAVKWVIMVIIFVFDPLAIALLLAGNFLIAKEKEEKENAKNRPAIGTVNVNDLDITVVPASEAYVQTYTEVEKPVEVIQEEPQVVEAPTVIEEPTPEEAPVEEAPVEEAPVEEAPVEEAPVEEAKPEVPPTLHWNRDYVVHDEPKIKKWSVTVPEEVVEAVPEEAPAEEVALLKKDESQQPIEEVPVQEPRQVIKLSDVNHVVHPDAPVHRSSLEDIDSRRGDVETSESFTNLPTALKRIYSE